MPVNFSTVPSSMNRFSGAPLGEAYTTASPSGWPQSNTVGVGPAGGHVGSPVGTPATPSPASITRSPCGPNANAPGCCTRNRHARPPSCGSSAHARPSATNATVSLGTALPAQCEGSAVPSPRVAPVGGGILDDVGGLAAVGDAVVVVVVVGVHEPATTTTATTTRKRRARIARTLHPSMCRQKRRPATVSQPLRMGPIAEPPPEEQRDSAGRIGCQHDASS